MATKSITSTRDTTSTQRYSDSSKDRRGRGASTRLLIGRLEDPHEPDLRTRTFIRFPIPDDWWDDVEYVESSEIELTAADGGDLANGDTGAVQALRLTESFSEGNHTVFHSDDYEWPSYDSSLKVHSLVPGAATPNASLSVNVHALLRRLAPKTVEFAPGKVFGMAKSNHGFALWGDPESDAGSAIQVWSHEASTAGYRPILTIQYEPKNRKPTAALVEPSGPVPLNFPFRGTFTDVDIDDHMTKVKVRIRKASASDWSDPVVAKDVDMAEDGLGEWEVTDFDRSKLKKGTNYEARCMVVDLDGKESDWSAANPFTISSIAPEVVANAISAPKMDGQFFTTDPDWVVDPLTEIVQVDLQVGTLGMAKVLWSKSYAPSKAERDEKMVQAIYQGPNLMAGSYTWRVRVHDGLDGVSAWSSAALALSTNPPDDEGLLDLTTSYSPVVAAQRIVIKKMGVDRGPGDVVGIIEDGSNIGCSWYATAPGEFYFTLPVTHPQCSVIEPMTTHYSFQQYRQGRWTELAAGLIRDFDANENDMVAYGVDYLGLLSMTVEAAHEKSDDAQRLIPTKVTGTNGSKYHKRTIKSIIVDQLKRAQTQDPHSPVKFIERGRIDSFSTKVTIFASFAERLSFIRGLIESHKGGQLNGEERRSRLRVRYNASAAGGQGRYQFEALDAVGKDRPNIRLEYGGLIQGYQVIALDDFVTRIYGIGKVPNHTLPNYAAVNAPGISQADWGSLGRANFWNDLVDSSDLQRRARNMATRMSRVGKRIALGIRVAGIRPFEGYDILDSFPIDIRDGVVDTSQYGSGMWTLWGMEYRVYPDEHDEITFILRPKGDTSPIDSDLIPSRPIHYVSDFVWGNGPP